MVKEHGIKPDIITYTSFVKVSKFASCGGAAVISMVIAKSTPIHYFLKAAGRGGHVDAAEKIFRSIKRVINPTEHTYKHLMGANIKAERCINSLG